MKLHLGCGKRDFGRDWVHIDGGDFPHVMHHDITRLPFIANSASIIYASHVLEYFDREEVVGVLAEWHRVLQPKGILRLAVPNFEVFAKLYVAKIYDCDRFLGSMYGKMKMGYKTIYHKTMYDYYSLIKVLEQAEFRNYRYWDWRKTSHSHIDDCSQAYLPHMDKENGVHMSLNLEAIK